jgi:lysophospholipase L1-like esterase
MAVAACTVAPSGEGGTTTTSQTTTTAATTTTTIPGTTSSTDDAPIWFAGDSVTNGYTVGNLRWPDFLDIEHRNVAAGGLTIRQVKNLVLDLIADDGAPDHIYVMAGINNIGLYGHGLPELQNQVLEFESEVDVPITWITITPLRWITERRDDLNEWLRTTRPVIDCGDALGNPLAAEYSWGDRVHLKNPGGHVAFAACVAPLLG